MKGEKIRFVLRFRTWDKPGTLTAQIFAQAAYRVAAGYGDNGKRTEEALVAEHDVPYDNSAHAYDQERAEDVARKWAVRGLAKAFHAFFGTPPQDTDD